MFLWRKPPKSGSGWGCKKAGVGVRVVVFLQKDLEFSFGVGVGVLSRTKKSRNFVISS